MRVDQAEIYSDEINKAVIRHPDRRFPGVLVQGDTLWGLCFTVDKLCASSRDQLAPDQFEDLNKLRNSLWGFLTHYKAVLGEHDIPLPFSEIPVHVSGEA